MSKQLSLTGLKKRELYDQLLSSLDAEFGDVDVKPYINDPVKFAVEVVGIEPTPDQEEMLMALVDHGHVSIRSGHGVGKTTGMALCALWFMSTRPHCKIPVTAPTANQLHDILFAEIIRLWRQMKSQFKDVFDYTSEKFYHKQHKENWAIYPRTSRVESPEALQGFHAENLLFLIDEGAGVANTVFEVAEGSLTSKDNWVLMCGNPTKLSGFFYDAFHRDRSHWETLHFKSTDSPLVDPSYPERMEKKYGKDSNIYRVRVLGEFPTSEEDQLIPIELLENAVQRDVPDGGRIVWGLDVARFGSDKTALCIRKGDVIEDIRTVAKYDTMQTVGWVISQINDLKPEDRPEMIFVDVIGIGSGVADRLREQNFPVTDVNVATSASESDRYGNLRAELWHRFKDWLLEERGKIPDNEDLIAQSSALKYKFDSSGRIMLERKEDMKRRGLPSPDLADAVVLTFAEDYGDGEIEGYFSDTSLQQGHWNW